MAFRFLISYCLVAVLILLSGLPSEAFQTDISPAEIYPGDLFVLRVTGPKELSSPDAAFHGQDIIFSRCGDGCFVGIGAVDVETAPGNYLVNLTGGNEHVGIKLLVSALAFPEHHLTLPDEKVFLSPEDLQRARREAEKLDTLWTIVTDRLWSGSFIRPLENDVSTVFGEKRIINKKKNSRHRGIDIRGTTGEEVRASNSGRVVLAEELFFGGNTVVLDHGQGIYTIYMHLSSLETKKDAFVSKGDIVGLVGSTGRSTGPHLHFGVKVNSISINPISLIQLPLL